MRLASLSLPLCCAAAAALACSADPSEPADPGVLGDAVKRALADLGDVPQPVDGLEYNLFELDGAELAGDVTAATCDAVDNALIDVCSELQQAGETDYCSYDTAFFYANDVPRCAVRFHTYLADDYTMAPMHLIDFSGAPIAGPVPSCGNGELDSGEECDDGNHELWDGCDSTCKTEPFNGCEAVIQDYYQQAGLAMVDQSRWDGARSHLMVNRHAIALAEVSQANCQAAIATADDVCRELESTMPFVGWCQPEGRYRVEDGEGACSIRFRVWFSGVDQTAGAYTTSLPGILAFTIR